MVLVFLAYKFLKQNPTYESNWGKTILHLFSVAFVIQTYYVD